MSLFVCNAGRTLVRRVILASSLAVSVGSVTAADVGPGVLRALEESTRVDVLIEPTAPPARLHELTEAGFERRMAAAVARLRDVATGSQAELLAELERRDLPHRAFWVSNVVWAQIDRATLDALAKRQDVKRIQFDAAIQQRLPEPLPDAERAPTAIEWGVQRVNAPALWALGHRGQGVVIAGQDTGYQWDHPALREQYRGWNGVSADHNYHWHDAIHVLTQAGVNPCGVEAQQPCDDDNHGTHTMGSMVGDDGASNQIGVAPAARWIGCRNMDRGDGRPSTYLECFQWFMAPTDLAGNNPDPSRAPHIINNSWGCPPSEGCTTVDAMKQAVENLRNAGILVVVSAGNSGSACATIDTAPAPYAASFTVGATNSVDAIANFSSRGPGAGEDPFLAKPDLVAPGVSVRSSVSGNAYSSFSGTSMAGPHVAGVAALLMSASPSLIGQPAQVEALLRASARPLTSAQTCGQFPGSVVPNAVFGHGIVDAAAAFAALGQLFGDGFESAAPQR